MQNILIFYAKLSHFLRKIVSFFTQNCLIFYAKLSHFLRKHLYTWSFKVNSIFIIIMICFLLSKLNINWFLLFFIVLLQIIVMIFYSSFGNWSSSCQNFYGIYEKLCVFTALLQDQKILIWIPLPKLIYELFLIYS